MPRLILASKSPRRKKLLEQLGLTFEVIPSAEDEIAGKGLPPDQVVLNLSLQKAESVAIDRFNSIVIAADTIVVCEDDVLGQPASEQDAVEMLETLSGKTHSVYTGVAIICTKTPGERNEVIQFSEQTKVTFATLTNREIEAYVRSGSPLDKAGAYGIQDEWGSVFVSGIEGDYYNVVGLPVYRFYQVMKRIAPGILEKAQGSNEKKD